MVNWRRFSRHDPVGSATFSMSSLTSSDVFASASPARSSRKGSKTCIEELFLKRPVDKRKLIPGANRFCRKASIERKSIDALCSSLSALRACACLASTNDFSNEIDSSKTSRNSASMFGASLDRLDEARLSSRVRSTNSTLERECSRA